MIKAKTQVLEKKGVYGKCSCNGEILFYSDRSVRCSSCNKLYGLLYSSVAESLKHRINKKCFLPRLANGKQEFES
ncbi:MAG: hypothetical protein QW698_03040 [Nitrososphaerales archaeon]